MCGCGAQGLGLVVDLAALQLFDSVILKVFSKLYDSMIL